MKSTLLKHTALLAVVACSLGMLAGCASSDQEDIVIVPDCYDEAGIECVVMGNNQTAMYLPELTSETYSVTSTTTTVPEKPAVVISAGNTDLARSRPAGDRGVSVADKPKRVVSETVEKDVVATQTANGKKIEKTVVETVVTETKKVDAGAPVVSISATETVQKKTVKTSALADKVAYGEQCHDWEASAGTTLRTLLMEWGEKSGWTVVWKLDRDYNLEAGVVFRGTFTEVSGALVRSFARATPAPIGTFYKGNRVLVINTQEDENAD